jgi:hypothetical protein
VPNPIELTPTERLATFSLAATPNQTAEQIFRSIGGKTYSHLKVALHSLALPGIITSNLSPAGIVTYSLGVAPTNNSDVEPTTGKGDCRLKT